MLKDILKAGPILLKRPLFPHDNRDMIYVDYYCYREFKDAISFYFLITFMVFPS